MNFFNKFAVILFLITLVSCNKNLTEEEKKEMWSKAQTTGEIINRSGTKFNPSINKEVALQDAETRLQTGGGLFGKKGMSLESLITTGDDENVQGGMVSMPVNQYLWKGALETINFMPLSSTDPFGGTIITDWYTSLEKENERCKLNIFINGSEFKSQNLKVTSFCQVYKDNKWLSVRNDPENNIKIENAILNNAKKLRLQ